MSNLKWINFNKNNSGGYFIQNEEVSALVCVQGKGLEQIKRKAESLFSGNDSYCECCGERWSTWVDESDLTDEPSYYETPLKEELGTFNRDGYATLHFNNGEVRYVKNHCGEYAELEVCPEEVL